MPIKEVPAKDLKVDDLVQVEDWPSPTRVRGIHIVLHMSNGMDLVVEPDQEIWRAE